MEDEDGLVDVEIVKRRADVLKVQAHYRMDGVTYDSVSEAHQQIVRDHVARDILFTIYQKILGKRLHEETQLGQAIFFASWWQHLKATIFPEWLLRFFPIKTRTEVFEVKYVWNICPHYASAIKDDAKHIEFVTYDKESSEEEQNEEDHRQAL